MAASWVDELAKDSKRNECLENQRRRRMDKRFICVSGQAILYHIDMKQNLVRHSDD